MSPGRRVGTGGADDGEVVASCAAEHTAGLAARERDDLRSAISHLRRAVRVADRHGLAQQAALSRLELVGTLAMAGDTAAALREAERAAPALRGRDLSRLHHNRATALVYQGRLDEAMDGYRAALRGLRRAGDVVTEAKLLNNRSMVHAARGDLVAADSDLRRAEQLFLGLGADRAAATIRQNLGFVAARTGDLPSALRWFDMADAYFRTHGMVDAIGLRDRCEALVAARLLPEARAAAEAAVRQLEEEGKRVYVAEARLLLAEVARLQGDLVAATAEAGRAAEEFRRQRRRSWRALARKLVLLSSLADGTCSPALLAEARRVAAVFATAGWTVQQLDAQIVAARIALALGRADVARAELRPAAHDRRRMPADVRARAWHAQALLRLADGDRRGASAALRAGLGVLDRYRASLGATELRTGASSHGAELASTGLTLALEDGSPALVLQWVERWKAGCLRLHPARPRGSPALIADLARLRRLTIEIEQAALSGRSTARLLPAQVALEESVRDRARHAGGDGLAPVPPPLKMDALRRSLGDRALVELAERDGVLLAVVVGRGRPRVCELGPTGPVHAELENLRFAMRRLSLGAGRAASLAAAGASAAHARRTLDASIFGPLTGEIGDRALVVVPTGPLHALPWCSLPSCRGRPVVVAPSAASWMGGQAPWRPRRRRPVVLAAGPGLPHATEEVAALALQYPAARRLVGDEATADALLGALDGAELVHLAAHGRFRSDNPMFSALQLSDGPLTVYDLEGIRTAPRCLVLSACDSGLSEVRAGDELMGLVAAVLALGTRTLVASVSPVPDAETKALMVDLHGRLRAGAAPAEALAAAQVAVGGEGSRHALAAGAFVCFGAGWQA